MVDKTGGVESAFVVTGDGSEQPLRQLLSGYFYGIPQLEGTIQVRSKADITCYAVPMTLCSPTPP